MANQSGQLTPMTIKAPTSSGTQLIASTSNSGNSALVAALSSQPSPSRASESFSNNPTSTSNLRPLSVTSSTNTNPIMLLQAQQNTSILSSQGSSPSSVSTSGGNQQHSSPALVAALSSQSTPPRSSDSFVNMATNSSIRPLSVANTNSIMLLQTQQLNTSILGQSTTFPSGSALNTDTPMDTSEDL